MLSVGALAFRCTWFAGLDAVVCDLQDIGSRYYTYVWTLVMCLEACAGRGPRVMVLDRPNPLGGAAVEGETGSGIVPFEEDEPELADLEFVAVAQHHPVDALLVDVGAVERSGVDDRDDAVQIDQSGHTW